MLTHSPTSIHIIVIVIKFGLLIILYGKLENDSHKIKFLANLLTCRLLIIRDMLIDLMFAEHTTFE